jgi:hypothetical protein
MKPSINICFAAALLCFASMAQASPTIELKDGSRIVGDIQGIEHGAYIVTSPSIGTVHVAQSDIARILYRDGVSGAAASSGKSSAADDAVTGNIQQLQNRLAQDPATLQSIMSLQSDPQIQAVLNDPSIMKAIQNGDFTSLLGNAKIQSLENNAHVKQLVQQLEH